MTKDNEVYWYFNQWTTNKNETRNVCSYDQDVITLMRKNINDDMLSILVTWYCANF